MITNMHIQRIELAAAVAPAWPPAAAHVAPEIQRRSERCTGARRRPGRKTRYLARRGTRR